MDAPLVVIHEDDAVLVVDKPAGVLAHPVAAGEAGTLRDAVAAHRVARGRDATVHLVHRLDRDTSGLLLVAQDAAAHRRLARQLERRTLRRTYLALVAGVPGEDEGVVDAPVGRDPHDPPKRAVRDDGEAARTRWRVVERLAGAALLACALETGRTHQVRVHLRHLGHPILGDRWYGGAGPAPVARQALHAWRLAFAHPATGLPVAFESPLPPDLAALRARLAAG